MFEKYLGNEKIKEILTHTIETQNILHSYLFIGIEGIGKKLFAQEFAKKILCLASSPKEDSCKSCIEFTNQNHPDFMQIEPEEGKTIKIEQIRYMQQKILEKPIISTKKVYIVNDCDKMTKEAQNCLLKTLEEPPEYAVLLLITNNESKLLNTIKSRCIKMAFQPISEETIQKWLKETQATTLIKACEGSIGKLMKMQEQQEIYQQVEEIISHMKEQSLLQVWRQAEILYKQKDNIQDVLNYMNQVLMQQKQITYINCISDVENTKRKILANNNYDMSIDQLILQMWEKIHP